MTQVLEGAHPHNEAELTGRDFRPEIQALRAIAVMGVVLFHFWPGFIRGGYAGVDVFFVISGYLITAHLLREAESTGRVRLLRFWGRRIRRLLPAALFVIGVSTVLTVLFAPQVHWSQWFRELIASALYVENWTLAHDAVDYLGAENDPSIAQHYWSLSVEEQFYLFWPLLILVACVIAARRRIQRVNAVRAVVVGVFVLSFAASVYVTFTNPAAAYFVTHTRAWEFAAGALVAVAPWKRLPERIAGPLRWVAWISIAAALVLYPQTLPFPGWVAALPVLATAAVIWCASPASNGLLGRIIENPVIQGIGTVSYSMYLWHWPLAVLLPTAGFFWDTPGRGLLAVAISYVLASLTLTYIENPVRFHDKLTSSVPRTFAVGFGGMALVSALAAGGLILTDRQAEADTEEATKLAGEKCFGAAAFLDAPCSNDDLNGVLLPSLSSRAEDTGGAYSCYATQAETTSPAGKPRDCHAGSDAADARRIALVGDSHAAALSPGLRAVADRANWSLDIFVGWGGTLADAPGSKQAAYREVLTQQLLEGDYDAVIVTARRDPAHKASGTSPLAAMYAAGWRPLLDAGIDVIALADNPLMDEAAKLCLESAGGLDDAAACSMTPAQAWALNDPLPAAVEQAGNGAHLIDLSDAYCDDDTCPLVIGHVLVYRDNHHITATFSKTLAPYVVAEVDRIIG